MTRQPYPPLRPQPPVRAPRRQPTPWPMIVGIVFLAVLAVAIALVLLGGGDDPGTSGPSGSGPLASGSASASLQPSSSPVETPPGESSPTPAAGLGPIVATAVDELSLRAGPSTAAERLGSLALGALSFVAGGPVEADGFRWYLVSALGLPPNSGCATPIETDPYNCPLWFGWVADAGGSGEAWLTPHQVECPAQPLTAEGLILGRTSLERLACFGSTPITFRAWWPTIPEGTDLSGSCAAQDQPSGWLLCQQVNHNAVTISPDQGFGGIGARVSIDPASGLTMPERGTWLELRVHLDDPAAQGCDEAAQALPEQARPPEQYVLDCRAEMVLEAVQAVPGP